MKHTEFAWTIIDALEAHRWIELPGLPAFRASKLIVPDHVWYPDEMNWDMIRQNAPKGLIEVALAGEYASHNLVLVDADQPGRIIVVDPALISSFATCEVRP